MQQLRQHVQSCVPAHWRVATLELDMGGVPQMGLRSIRHRLHNPATGEEVDDLTQMVFDDTHALHAVFTEFDQAWRSSAISSSPDRPAPLATTASSSPPTSGSPPP